MDNDIDAEISEEEAHANYGVRVADWLALNALHLGILTANQAQQSLLNFAQYETETNLFLEPFFNTYQFEQQAYVSRHVQKIQVDWYIG